MTSNIFKGRIFGLQASLAAVAGMSLSLASMACGVEDDSVEGYDQLRLVELADDATCVTLYAGQSIDVGTVCVTVDNTVDTSATCGAGAAGAMNVTYTTTGGWTLGETHLAAGDELSDIPANKKGNPKIGNFPYASGDIGGATTHEVSVPMCEFGLDAADTSCDPVKAYLAAHAVVKHDNGDGSFQEETAWGDGERMVKKGSWAEYFNMHLECSDNPEPPPPPQATCETAFALAGNGDETCFIGADFDDDGADDGFNRWGWSNEVSPGTTLVQWPVYAAAGQCNLGNGTLVGHLTVNYDGSTADVTFDRVDGFTLDEEHLYIGTEPLPRDNNGEYTVAPGQYPIVVELDDATQTNHSVGGFTGETLYVVYHGVACGDYGDDGGDPGTGDGGSDGGDDGGSCTDPLAALNDEFDGDLSGWSIHNPQDAAVSTTVDDQLELLPVHGPGWYADGEAVHVNKTVSGNFAVSSYVTVTDLQGGPAAPGDPYRIGGLMIRDPSAGTVNSYHMGIGDMGPFGDGGVVVVSKRTIDSSSQVGTNNDLDLGDGTVAEMKICRFNDDVQGLIRLPGNPWTVIDWHVRPDLPAEVVAGPISYAWDPGNAYTDPDLRTTCDYVHFETIESLADCMKDYDPAC